jgi:anaphase-promoting complex subunit 2
VQIPLGSKAKLQEGHISSDEAAAEKWEPTPINENGVDGLGVFISAKRR